MGKKLARLENDALGSGPDGIKGQVDQAKDRKCLACLARPPVVDCYMCGYCKRTLKLFLEKREDPLNCILVTAIFHKRADHWKSFTFNMVNDLQEGKKALKDLEQAHKR